MTTNERLISDLIDEQRQRWPGDNRLSVEAVFALHPKLLDEPDAALQFIYSEVMLRTEAGETVDVREYVGRFPQFVRRLGPLFEVHDALESSGLFEGGLESATTVDELDSAVRWPEVAGYEIINELGRGGMGVVYKARQRALNRVVALKMILVHRYADAGQLARFRAESQTVARLQHPNIVQIYDVGEQDGRPYLALELLEGGSLAQALNHTPQPARPVARLVETLARAVHAVHERGIIHRDLKPGNILLQAPGSPAGTEAGPAWASLVPKIVDFGLAKDVDSGQTASGAILGTPAYMAPEQAAGKTSALGPSADVYALGAILYEALTGRPPLQGVTALQTLDLLRSVEPAPPSRLQPGTPRDLQTICLKCLEKEPNRRYASALELAEDLARFLSDRPIRARPAGALERAWRWRRRNPGVALLAASIVGLLLLLAGGASLSALWLSQELAHSEQAEQTAQQQRDAAVEQLWNASVAKAQALRVSGRMGQRHESLVAIREAARITRERGAPAAEVLSLRNEAIACFALSDLHVRDVWRVPSGRFFSNFDPAMSRYACPDEQGNIHLKWTAGHRHIATLPRPDGPIEFLHSSFSADGRYYLAYYVMRNMRHNVVWDLTAQGAPRPVLRLDDCWCALAPDSRTLAAARQDLTLGLYDLESGAVKTLCRDFRATFMAFRPDGKQLAYSDDLTSEVRLLDATTGALVRTFADPDRNTGLAWHNDNRLLAAASGTKRIFLWDTHTGRQHAALDGHQARIMWLAFSPNGQLLASSGWDGMTRLWDAWSGRPLVSVAGRPIAFSRDGSGLAFANGADLGIWDVEEQSAFRLLQPRDERGPDWHAYRGHEAIDYDPTGRFLASAGGDGTRLWDAATGQELAHLDSGYTEAALFHPARSELFTYGRNGLQLWPIAPDKPAAGARVGPARKLYGSPNTGWFQTACTPDGRAMALSDDRYSQVVILKVDDPKDRVVLLGCSDVTSLALSPDGKWLAAGTLKDPQGITIWDARSGRQARRLPTAADGTVQYNAAFSPDGRWLVTGSQSDYRLWEVGSWAPGPVIPRNNPSVLAGPLAFSRDGRILALARSIDQVQMLDFPSLRELATLTAPDPHPLSRLCFNPDGTELAASTDNHLVRVWDLRAIRRQLGALGLGWADER